MTDRKTNGMLLQRRTLLKGAASGAVLLAAPAILTRRAAAQGMDTSSFENAGIDWRQAEGASITIGVIPAGYFQNLEAVLPAFSELTGVNARLEMTPPGQIRQKAVLDLSSKTGTWASHAADPMYYDLYVANGWVDALDGYLGDAKLTGQEWFDYEDILEGWRGATSVDGKPYGIPYDGEATIQVYRKDVYDEAGLKPAETLKEYAANAAKVHSPDSRLWGAALRGFKGAGQNMYIYPSIFRAFGGEWFDGDRMVVNSEEAIAALDWYVKLLNGYAPPGVENWNWPDIADAFGQGTLGSYIDAHSSAAVIANPEKSKVVGKIGFARWPKGPSGKRVTSIWNWSFPINAALSEKDKAATWLFIQWAASKETQAATSYAFDGAYKRSGVNRTSLWQDEKFTGELSRVGDNFIEATQQSFTEDTDVDWRPRLPQWPAVGETMATAIQASLVGQASVKAALDEAQARIDGILKG
ncbi:MAG: sugar ABC transporter substrate-binding protein [Rhizobiaceae bacterium]|nr:sugar ABC transporter substrate-binding protein [Rhizobiaceae bacterium]MCV0406351.1 sugar ABC transporter substrate-binding protein [Rhizobiaceae bacterium]